MSTPAVCRVFSAALATGGRTGTGQKNGVRQKAWRAIVGHRAKDWYLLAGAFAMLRTAAVAQAKSGCRKKQTPQSGVFQSQGA